MMMKQRLLVIRNIKIGSIELETLPVAPAVVLEIESITPMTGDYDPTWRRQSSAVTNDKHKTDDKRPIRY